MKRPIEEISRNGEFALIGVEPYDEEDREEEDESENQEELETQENEDEENQDEDEENQGNQGNQDGYPFEDFEFEPSQIERQVVRLSLATICRSNMYDWDLDYSSENVDCMTLVTNGIISDETDTMIPCEITISIYYELTTTFCTINYVIKKSERVSSHVLGMNWETSPRGSRVLSLNKDVTTTSCFLFSNTTNQSCDLRVYDTRESSWCYFIDARYHLNRISPH